MPALTSPTVIPPSPPMIPPSPAVGSEHLADQMDEEQNRNYELPLVGCYVYNIWVKIWPFSIFRYFSIILVCYLVICVTTSYSQYKR